MIDRSRFKKSSASQLQQSDKDLNKTLGRKERNNSNGHDIEEGPNLFRFYPVHPDIAEKDPKAVFAIAFTQTFLPAMVQEKDGQGTLLWLDNEKKKPKLKTGVRPVWNTKVHGNKPKDLVEEYINLARTNAKEMNLNEADAKEYLKPIYGAFSKDKSKNIQGINYPLAWVAYADKYPNANPAATPVFDELKIKKSIKERINKISQVEAASDPLGTDPFTDIEEGKAVKILYDPKADQAANYYTTEIDNSSVKEVIGTRTVSVQKTYPLTDAQLDYFLAAEPLHTKYGAKLATRKNFEAQLTGLEMFDSKWQMGIFELPQWEKIVAEIDSYYPEVDAPEASATTETVVAEEVSQEEETDEFELMNRQELTTFAKDNKTGILVRPAITDDVLREKLRAWKLALVEIPHIDLPTDNVEVKEEVAAEVIAPKVEAEKKSPLTVVPKETEQERAEFLADLNKIPEKEVVEEKELRQPAAVTGVVDPKEKLRLLREKMKGNAAVSA